MQRTCSIKIGICSVLKCVLYTTTNGPNDRLLALEIEKSGNYDRCWRNLLLKHTSSSNETKDTADLEFLVTTMTNMIKPDLREEQRKKFVEDMIAFFTEEGKPRNGTIKPVKVPAKGNKTTGLKTIRQLEEALDGFPLLNVLNSQFRLWNTTFTESELVAIGGIGKVKALLDFYMDNDPYVVFNNFGLKEAAKLLRYSSKQYLNSLMSLCNESQTTRERFCVRSFASESAAHCEQVVRRTLPGKPFEDGSKIYPQLYWRSFRRAVKKYAMDG
ncbi:uncharacterized protein LOC125940350 [Dermacentor silvarum]|uniref:uncharacterized protein LOC125940350 n=1 Tax=Dermacentor silvarum TaxID=543639 RepID=UPI002100BF4C|nr:uncharacterized protein LOC125940350 [Dermacentor silvarum]